MHFGVGNFFRAHAALYFEDAGYDVYGVSLKSEAMRLKLKNQDYLYTVCDKESRE